MKTIVQKVKFNAAPKKIYDIFLDAKKHARATGAKAAGNGRLGGNFTAWDGYIKGKNIALVPGRMIVQSWWTKEFKTEDHDSILILTFEKTSDGTLLTMTHTAVPDHKAADFKNGWPEAYWSPIRKYLSNQ